LPNRASKYWVWQKGGRWWLALTKRGWWGSVWRKRGQVEVGRGRWGSFLPNRHQFVENGAGGSRLCESNGCGARFSKNAGRLCDNEGGGGPWQNREPRYSVWQKRERVVCEHSISGVVGSSAAVWLEKAERARRLVFLGVAGGYRRVVDAHNHRNQVSLEKTGPRAVRVDSEGWA